jgi:hypothetical protein
MLNANIIDNLLLILWAGVNRKRKSLQDDPMKGRKRGFNAYS